MTTDLMLNRETIYQATVTRPEPRSGTCASTDHGWLQVFARWADRRRQRLALAKLDDRLLADIGVTRSEAAREIDKPFWR